MADQILPTNVNSANGIGEAGTLDFKTLFPQIIERFIGVMEGVLIIVVGFFAIRYIRKYLKKIEVGHEQQRNAINLLDKIISGFIIVISITLALKVVGIDMTLLVSVLILGLSYGLQDIIKNYVAGILILFKSPFKIGETVKIRDFTGKVYRMDFQSTTLETFDHRYITIYNSDVMTQSIVNFSNGTVRRIEMDIMLGYGSDAGKALQIFEKILMNHPQVLKDPKYSVQFKKFNDNSIQLSMRFWIQQPNNILKIKSQIALLINEAFNEENIYMPYTKDIQIESDYTMSEGRKNRLQTFFSQPAFAEAQAEIAPGTELDSEEPE